MTITMSSKVVVMVVQAAIGEKLLQTYAHLECFVAGSERS